jgi:hypothetical protein
MVQSNLAFEQFVQTMASSSRASTSETLFLHPGFKWDDPNMFADCLYSRNIMAESIICFGYFWLSTYAPLFLGEALGEPKNKEN